MSERVFFINNEWLTYSQAHLLGYTLVKPKILTLYRDDFTTVQIKQDVTDNTFYDSDNHRWVRDINVLNLYLKLGRTNLYYGESYKVYDSFTDSAFSTEPKYMRINDSLVSVELLYNNEGATLYPCEDYSVNKTSVLVWYDDRTSLYWDDQTGRKFWSGSPPVVNIDHKDSVITPSTSKMEPLPQWEYDLSQVPTHYRVSSFASQDKIFNSQEHLKFGFQFVDSFDEIQNLVDFKFYTDITELNVTFYVFPEEGTYDYEDIFHPQGDTFLGDYQYVWVDSDGQSVFYLDRTKYILEVSHDEFNPVIYLLDGKYYLESTLHANGFTRLPCIGDIGIYTDNPIGTDSHYSYCYYSETEGGYYVVNSWYSDETALNNTGIYFYDERILFLSTNLSRFYYHGIWYDINNVNYTYEQAHTAGYTYTQSENVVLTDDPININVLDGGMYNRHDGFYYSEVWYADEHELNNAGLYLIEKVDNTWQIKQMKYNLQQFVNNADYTLYICNYNSSYEEYTINGTTYSSLADVTAAGYNTVTVSLLDSDIYYDVLVKSDCKSSLDTSLIQSDIYYEVPYSGNKNSVLNVSLLNTAIYSMPISSVKSSKLDASLIQANQIYYIPVI